MTLDEAIKHAEEVAEENRNVDEGELDLLYCGDTECIEAHKSNCIACAEEHEQLAKWLKELKQLKEQTRWIPCSERTPEKSGVYIVTEKEYFVDDREHTGRFNLITEQVEFEDGKWRRASFYEVIAWMSLPNPYKAETEMVNCKNTKCDNCVNHNYCDYEAYKTGM